VANDRREQQGEERHVLGLPTSWIGPRSRQDEEPRRMMGFPVDSIGPRPEDLERLRASLAHPVRSYQRWLRRRRLGPYATDEDEG
jgi:hypothetical protein